MAARSRKPIPAQQGGLFCRTCSAPLIIPEEQHQQECDRCYDLFAPEPAAPASPTSPEPIADDLAAAWLSVEREAGDEPALTEHAGVWLVAIGLESFERAWAAIRSATAEGRLGPSARVVSARSYKLPRAWSGPKLVIEVTTYDARDEADVWRVRQALRDLGVAAAMTFLPNPAQRPVAPVRARPRLRSFLEEPNLPGVASCCGSVGSVESDGKRCGPAINVGGSRASYGGAIKWAGRRESLVSRVGRCWLWMSSAVCKISALYVRVRGLC